MKRERGSAGLSNSMVFRVMNNASISARDNILSIDLESWVHFYADALKDEQHGLSSSDRKKLDNGYIPSATTNILNLLEEYNQKATFFVLGEIYDWYPEVIEEIDRRGCELAYHTHSHAILRNGEILEKELEQSRDFIERFNIIGFRAPQIFITSDSMAHLRKYGIKYSSSTYGEYKIKRIEGIDEIPVSTLFYRRKREKEQSLPRNLTMRMLSREIPFGSGLCIALFGSGVSRFIGHLNRNNVPAILFVHPWQLYQSRKIEEFSFKLKVLYRNPLCIPYTRNILKSMEKLLKLHRFVSFRDYFGYEQ